MARRVFSISRAPKKRETATPAPAETEDPETYVYATVGSKLYHTTSCRRLCYSSHKYTLYEAHFSGYSPCDLCNPGVYGQ